jgi:hypothetical protein
MGAFVTSVRRFNFAIGERSRSLLLKVDPPAGLGIGRPGGSTPTLTGRAPAGVILETFVVVVDDRVAVIFNQFLVFHYFVAVLQILRLGPGGFNGIASGGVVIVLHVFRSDVKPFQAGTVSRASTLFAVMSSGASKIGN